MDGVRRSVGLRGVRWVQAVAGIAVPVAVLDSVPLLGSGWLTGSLVSLFSPASLAAPWGWPELRWGCFGQPMGPPEAPALGWLVHFGESLSAVTLVAAVCIAVQTVLMISTRDRMCRRWARVYSTTTWCALLSYFSLIEGALLAIEAQ
jgi:hypothetical protein